MTFISLIFLKGLTYETNPSPDIAVKTSTFEFKENVESIVVALLN